MKTGDSVQDGHGRTFQVGQLLGRGLWGKTYTAREEPSGAEWVIKVPLGPDAFSSDGEQHARICREIALEQGRLLVSAACPALVRVEARFTTPTGLPVLVLPRQVTSLQARLVAGCTLEDVLRVVATVVPQLRLFQAEQRVHGMLRPTNILGDGKGAWVLADPSTPTLLRHLPALARARGMELDWLPPECRTRHEQPLADPSADTWALTTAVLRIAGSPPDPSNEAQGPMAVPMPRDGLDKGQLVALKDEVRNRLQAEPSNVRFHTKVADRLATLLNRALSQETSPSPPYRFPRLDEYQARVEEVAALVRPGITHVGRVLLDRPPGGAAFTTEEEIAFSTSVGCSAGVETHDDIGAGMAFFELSDGNRIRDVACSYTVDRHPSGRYRFGFRVAPMRPGHYRVRVAFTIRDSGDEPATAEGEFQVHPAAGYVPPAEPPSPKAIRFTPPEDPDTVTEVGREPTASPVAGIRLAGDVVEPVPSTSGEAVVRPAAAVATPAAVDPAPRVGPRPLAPGDGPSAVARPVASLSAGTPTVASRPVSGRPVSDPGLPSVSLPPPRPAQAPPVDVEPEYRGAGKWTDLPLPGGGLGGPAVPGDDRDLFDEDATEPLDPDRLPGDGLFDRLLAMTEGDAYKLFIGGAGLIILVLVVLLFALR
ncbi:MAG: hypothetical protein H6742_06960 [Alphaproteobacteria bacterium]|nr:hypothetical protein [Alphaproteobacteria bacterium]